MFWSNPRHAVDPDGQRFQTADDRRHCHRWRPKRNSARPGFTSMTTTKAIRDASQRGWTATNESKARSGQAWLTLRPTRNPNSDGCEPPQPLFHGHQARWGQIGDNGAGQHGLLAAVASSASRCEPKRSALVVPAHLQSSPQFLVGHVQVALRLLDARVSEHQLDDADVHAVGEQATGAFVPQVVPAQVDALELFTVPDGARAAGLGPRGRRRGASTSPTPSGCSAGSCQTPSRTRTRPVPALRVASGSRPAVPPG